jgi:hypothetical protein
MQKKKKGKDSFSFTTKANKKLRANCISCINHQDKIRRDIKKDSKNNLLKEKIGNT